jgi:hypothetical protein
VAVVVSAATMAVTTMVTVIIRTGTNISRSLKALVTPGLLVKILLSIKSNFMERFSKQITVGNEARLFEFTRLENFGGVKFFITSIDENKKPFSFSVKRKDANHWKLVPGSLRWLYEIEEEISNAITETRLK